MSKLNGPQYLPRSPVSTSDPYVTHTAPLNPSLWRLQSASDLFLNPEPGPDPKNPIPGSQIELQMELPVGPLDYLAVLDPEAGPLRLLHIDQVEEETLQQVVLGHALVVRLLGRVDGISQPESDPCTMHLWSTSLITVRLRVNFSWVSPSNSNLT